MSKRILLPTGTYSKHTEAFYKKQYRKYQTGTIGKRDRIYNDFSEFKDDYIAAENMGKKNITTNWVFEEYNQIDFDTYRGERRALRNMGISVTKNLGREIKGLSTQDFARKYSGQIMNTYEELRKSGKTAKEANMLISSYYFGSN